MKHKAVLLGIVGVVVTALLAGCGDSESGGDQSNASTATGTPIRFYVVGPSTDDTQNGASQGKLGVAAAVTAINHAGGVKGHPLEPVYCARGMQSNANDIAACGRNAAADPTISAVVWSTNNFGSSLNPILEKAGIACLGCQAFTQADFTAKNLYGFDPGALQVIALATLGADQVHAKTINMAIPDVPTAHGLPPLLDQLGLKSRGLQLGQVAYVPNTAVDVTAQAGQLGDADLIINTLLEAHQAPFLQALRQQGSKTPTIISGSTNSAPGMKEQYGDDAEGTYVGSVFNRNSPGYQAYTKDLKAIKSENSALNTDQAISAWLSVRMFATIADELGGKPTRQGVLDKVKSFTAYDTQGLTPPIDFSKPGTFGGGRFPAVRNDAVYLMQYKDGKLNPIGDMSHIFGAPS